MSFRGAKRREIPQDHVCKTNSQGFLAPFVARNDIRTVNCVTPISNKIYAPTRRLDVSAGELLIL